MSRLGCSRATAVFSIGFLLMGMAIALMPRKANAHPESVSSLRFVLGPSSTHVTVILPLRDLSRWFPPGRFKNYSADVAAELATQVGDLIFLAWDEQLQRPSKTSVHPGMTGYIIVEADFAMPADAGSLQARSAMLANLPNDHQQLAMVEDARRGPAAQRILKEETLTAQQDTLAVDLPELPLAASQVSPTAEATTSSPSANSGQVTSAQAALPAVHPAPVHAMDRKNLVRGLLLSLIVITVLTARYVRRRGRLESQRS